MKSIRITVCLLALAALARSDTGDFPERAESFPRAAKALPKPAEIGPGFKYPWEGTAYTEAEWRGQFDSDPRGGLAMQKAQLESISDEQYREYMEGMAGLMEGLQEGGGGLGEMLTGGGAMPRTLRENPITRTQALEAIDIQLRGIHDWGTSDYSRSQPKPGAVEDSLGIVPSFDDGVNLVLTVYTDEYLTKQPEMVDLSGENLDKTVEVLKETERKVRLANEKQAEEYEKEFDSLARTDRTDSDTGKAILEELVRIATSSSRVEGKFLSGAKGHLVIVERKSSQGHSVTVMGRVRRGNAVVDLTRLADGPYAEKVWEESEKLLIKLSGQLSAFTR